MTAVVTTCSLTQEVAGSNNHFNYKYFCHWIQWKYSGKTQLFRPAPMPYHQWSSFAEFIVQINTLQSVLSDIYQVQQARIVTIKWYLFNWFMSSITPSRIWWYCSTYKTTDESEMSLALIAATILSNWFMAHIWSFHQCFQLSNNSVPFVSIQFFLEYLLQRIV